jgi:eukaryotic-like serine/threonine-protein kinase
MTVSNPTRTLKGMPDSANPPANPAASAPGASAGAAAPVRWFGHLQLLRLAGRSERTMAWRVSDSRSGQDRLLVVPRLQPADATAVQRWQDRARLASRVNHPNLARPLESGVHEGWPFAVYALDNCDTLAEKLGQQGLPGLEAAQLLQHVLQALAYAHDAGLAHHDLQPYLLLVPDKGPPRLAGLAVASEADNTTAPTAGSVAPSVHNALQWQRDCAERDVLCAGLLLHGVLVGEPPLQEADLGRVVQRMPPLGRETVHLPWTTPQPINDVLRAIVNRATERHERRRYRSARTLERALQGWMDAEGLNGGGPLALLGDRLRINGVLPAAPGAAARAARLATMVAERTNELAEVVLQDLALSFEMLRMVNSAQVRGAQISGAGPVLTVRRAIAMLGLEGVRRAASSLREWPGPLDDTQAPALQQLVDRCQRAAHTAQVLRPAAYDGEVVGLITVLQSLGRLIAQYHFAEEASQIQRLMQPSAATHEDEAEDPGMSEESAAFAVLGCDLEALGTAVARLWGLDDTVLPMTRRLSTSVHVRTPEDDNDMLRAVASCANEAVDALAQPAHRVPQALQRVVQRYGKLLGINLRELQQALQDTSSVRVA